MPTGAPGAFRLQTPSPPPQPEARLLGRPVKQEASPKAQSPKPTPDTFFAASTPSISKILAPRQHQNICLPPPLSSA